MLIQIRYLVCFTMFLGMLYTYLVRTSISVTIMTMARDPEKNSTHHHSFIPRLSLTENQQQIIQGAYFYGYLVTHYPSALILYKMGPRWLMFISLVGMTVFNLSIVPLSYTGPNLSFILIVISRIITGAFSGVLIPVSHTILGRWILESERTFLTSLTYLGCIFGLITTFILAFITELSVKGWEYYLYVVGGIGVVIIILWLIMVYDDPTMHPFISKAEKSSIINSLYPNGHPDVITLKEIPFKKIFLTPQLYLVIIALTSNNCILYMFLTNHPKYLKNVLHISPTKASNYSILPFLFNVIIQFIASIGTRYLENKFPSKNKHFFRRINAFIGFFGAASFIIPVGYFRHSLLLTEIFLSLSMGILAFNQCSYLVSVLDFSHSLAGHTIGYCNALSAIPGFAIPSLIASFTKTFGVEEGWKYSFMFIGCLTFFGGMIWILFGTSDHQDWPIKNHDVTIQSSQTIKTDQKFTI